MTFVKAYIHARLQKEDRILLEELKDSTGFSESELVRRGLRLVLREVKPKKTVGKFRKGPSDLATNKKYLAAFGR